MNALNFITNYTIEVKHQLHIKHPFIINNNVIYHTLINFTTANV